MDQLTIENVVFNEHSKAPQSSDLHQNLARGNIKLMKGGNKVIANLGTKKVSMITTTTAAPPPPTSQVGTT
jgi:hypothetical protein